jgi:hypothetical protein
MTTSRRKPDIYWEIIDHMPTTHPWERWVLTILAKRQAESGPPVVVTAQEFIRTGFTASQAAWTLRRLVDHGHIRQETRGGYTVKYPRRTNRWLWEQEQGP